MASVIARDRCGHRGHVQHLMYITCFILVVGVMSMPARGDHEQRRQQVARIAVDLVAAGGPAKAKHPDLPRVGF